MRLAMLLRISLVMALGACSSTTGDEAPAKNDASSSTGGSGGSGGTNATGGASSGGGPVDAGSDVVLETSGVDASTPDASTADSGAMVVLLDQPGAVFTPSASDTILKLNFGDPETIYRRVSVEFDVVAGDFQPEVPDEGNPDRTEHILFGLFRANQTKSDQRYLMGTAAVTWLVKASHYRMFGRLTIGAGYTTYTQWSGTYAWQTGTQYHQRCVLDGIAKTQVCELSVAGNVVKSHTGDVSYIDPTQHLSSGFYIELGRTGSNEIEVSPLGWQYSNLYVTGEI